MTMHDMDPKEPMNEPLQDFSLYATIAIPQERNAWQYPQVQPRGGDRDAAAYMHDRYESHVDVRNGIDEEFHWGLFLHKQGQVGLFYDVKLETRNPPLFSLVRVRNPAFQNTKNQIALARIAQVEAQYFPHLEGLLDFYGPIEAKKCHKTLAFVLDVLKRIRREFAMVANANPRLAPPLDDPERTEVPFTTQLTRDMVEFGHLQANAIAQLRPVSSYILYTGWFVCIRYRPEYHPEPPHASQT